MGQVRSRFALAVAVAVLAFPAGALAGTLDQSQTSYPSDLQGLCCGTFSGVAQTFTPGLSGKLDQVEVVVDRIASVVVFPAHEWVPPEDCVGGSGITAEIRMVAPGGAPSDVTALARANVPAESIPTTLPDPSVSSPFVSFTFSAPATVTAGNPYALVLSAPDSYCPSRFGRSAAYRWYGDPGGPYGGGARYKELGVDTVPDSSDWSLRDGDQAFKTYVVPEFTRTLSIAYGEKKHKFRGKLSSDSAPNCVPEQSVRVLKREKGRNPSVGSDTTDERGKYSLKDKNAEGKFYARAEHVPGPASGTCLAAKSETIRVG
jgi:hypothetical protein